MSFKTKALAVAITALAATTGAHAQADYSIHLGYGLPLDYGGQDDPTLPGFLNSMGINHGSVFTQDQIGSTLTEQGGTVPVWGPTSHRDTGGPGNIDNSISTGRATMAWATSETFTRMGVGGLDVGISLPATGGQASAQDDRYLGFQLNPHSSITYTSYSTFNALGADAIPVGALQASSLAEAQGLTLSLADDNGHFQTSIWARIGNPDLPPLPGLFTHTENAQTGLLSMTITNDQDFPLLGTYGFAGSVQGSFVAAVPEPGMASSLLLGLSMMGFLVRRSKRAASAA